MSYIYSGIGVVKVNGNTMGVDVMDIGITDPSGYSSLGQPVVTGIGKEVGMFKIIVKNVSAVAQNLAGTQTKDAFTGVVTPGTLGSYTTINSETQTGGSVDQILRVLAQTTTVLMYQVEGDNSGQISVMFEQQKAWADVFASNVVAGTGTSALGPYVAGLQDAIRALGTTVGVNSIDVSGTVVTCGSQNHYGAYFKLA